MQIIFTAGDSILSKAIRGVTQEPASHCALLFTLGSIEFVIHANLLGVHVDLADAFRIKAKILFVIEPKVPDSKAEAKLHDLLKIDEWALYDFGALLFDGLVLLAKHYLKLPLPKINLWQSSSMFLCTEWIQEYIDGKIDSMITPFQLYQKLVKSGDWIDKPV